MRDPDFSGLATRLIESGISPRHAHRTVNELRDHFDDLVDDEADQGANRRAARDRAASRLGDLDRFVETMASCRELKTWAFRFPRVALVVYPLACLFALPAVPFAAGVAHRFTIAKWGASLIAAGLVTAAMMLIMQLSILFT